MAYILTIPAQLKIRRREDGDKVVASDSPTFEEHKTQHEAEVSALDVIELSGRDAGLMGLKIEKTPSGALVHDYKSLLDLHANSKRDG